MGFELQRIVSDECHYGQYECNICQSLVDLDCLVTSACSHVFCRHCLLPWLEQHGRQEADFRSPVMPEPTPKCPTCNQNLLFSSSEPSNNKAFPKHMHSASMMVGGRSLLVQPLEFCQPLAHRVLKRIQVSCPLQQISACSWQGDYGDLQGHLLSPSAHIPYADAAGTKSIEENGSMPNDNPQEDASIHVESMDVETPKENNTCSVRQRTSSISSTRSVSSSQLALATGLKEEANSKFGTQHYREAADLYSKALSVLGQEAVPSSQVHRDDEDAELNKLCAALFSNRAACRRGLNDFEAAVQDASMALMFDPGYVKAYIRKSRALIQMADFAAAGLVISEGISRCNSSSLLQKEERRVTALAGQHEKSLELLDEKQFAGAKAELGNLLRETTSPVILLQAAQADLGMGLVDSARRLCLQALRQKPKDESTAYLVQGQCNILSASSRPDDQQLLDSGIALLKRAMRLDPDSPKAATVIRQWLKVYNLLKQARQATFERNFGSAVDLYSTCITTAPLLPPKAPLYSVLYTERAQGLLRLKRYDAVLQDVALVLYHREDHISAWLVRFAALHGKGLHEIVLEETEQLLQTWGNGEPRIRHAHEKAEFEARKAKRPDFYKMLGVSPIASEREIKKAYRLVARDMHPDRFAGASEEERSQAQQNFHLLSQGLEILTDDFQRKLYDEGYDPEAIKERVQAAEQAAHQSKYHRGYGFHGHHGYA